MENQQNYTPSMLIGEIKKNKKGLSYFMWGQMYCEIFKAKTGKHFVRAKILPKDDNYQKPNSSNNDWQNAPREKVEQTFSSSKPQQNQQADYAQDDIPF